MAELDPILWGDLERIDELGLLEPGEVLVERESAGLDAAPGALIVTDHRVLFFRSSPFNRKTHLVSFQLAEITSVEATERRSPIRKRGVLVLSSSTSSGADEILIFEHVPGGKVRADELARTILRQRDLLRRS